MEVRPEAVTVLRAFVVWAYTNLALDKARYLK